MNKFEEKELIERIANKIKSKKGLSWIIRKWGSPNCIIDSGRFQASYLSNELADIEEIIKDKFTTRMLLTLDEKANLGVWGQVESRIKMLQNWQERKSEPHHLNQK